MIRFLAIGGLLGIASGAVPGVYSGLIAATGLQAGFWTAFWVALVPVASESVVLAVSALFLSQLPELVLGWMGVAGGLLVLYLARRTWKESATPPEAEPLDGAPGRRLLECVFLALLSPAPWVFWLLVGAPVFLSAWRSAWEDAVVFFGSFLMGLVGVYLGIAALAGYGHRKLARPWHRRLMRGTSIVLAVAGGVLIWQSWVGNFERMVTGGTSSGVSWATRSGGARDRPDALVGRARCSAPDLQGRIADRPAQTPETAEDASWITPSRSSTPASSPTT